MATYSTRSRLVKQATNENKNTWGTTLNGGMIDMIDEAADGITALALTGDVTLTTANGATDQARKRVINITSSDQHARVITTPAVEKWYIVENESAFRVNIKTAAGAAAVVPGYCSAIVKCDGTDCFKLLQPDYGLISTTPTVNSAQEYTLTLTGFGCKNFFIWFEGVSNSTSGAIRGSVSPENSTYTAATQIYGQSAGGQVARGSIEIIQPAVGKSRFLLNVDVLGSNNTWKTTAPSGVTWPVWPTWMTGGVNYFKLDNNGGGNFTAGSIEVWGR